MTASLQPRFTRGRGRLATGLAVLLFGWSAAAVAGDVAAGGEECSAPCRAGNPVNAESTVSPAATAPDSARMARDLQQMPWPTFRRVVEAIPKLRASIEMYGPVGWQLVKDNYTTYNWKTRIDKLDLSQRQQLGELIDAVKSGR